MQNAQPKISGPGGGPIAKALAFIVGLGMLAAALTFSLIFLVIGGIALAVFVAYFAWKTRHLRKQMREQHEQMREQMRAQQNMDERASGRVIEGEVVSPARPDSLPKP